MSSEKPETGPDKPDPNADDAQDAGNSQQSTGDERTEPDRPVYGDAEPPERAP